MKDFQLRFSRFLKGNVDEEHIRQISIDSVLKQEEITQIIKESTR